MTVQDAAIIALVIVAVSHQFRIWLLEKRIRELAAKRLTESK